ncbi:DEAD/DEAH box helicase [Flammeovirga yaeyamensis]|uniref:DEAD/DEAH box helicase n=1 Tax=Flammeovirga yaeyamensis TaxID=367791 RepID=A0AAX1NC79_9BACT|nr:DEAD/DEAH box helicase [Flammeovirga yaeyamensis]MBB3697266.1 hypothetical protein [Flammeovirga yaeyamensis]NMF33923.1 DEAD/DEAH box helicase [Flammeovirga yaeyamensis]QWG04817.1 DEAD/DEAH box helicase [Flammeovirga yaeyamensis]
MTFNFDQFKSVEKQFEGVNQTTLDIYTTVLLTVGFRGEARSIVEGIITPYFSDQTRSAQKRSVQQACEEMEVLGMITPFQVQNGKYYHANSLEHFLFAVYHFSKRKDALVSECLSILQSTLPPYVESWGRSEFKLENALRDFILSDGQLQYIFTQYLNFDGVGSNYKMNLFFGYHTLVQFGYFETQRFFDLDADIKNRLPFILLKEIENGDADLNLIEPLIPSVIHDTVLQTYIKEYISVCRLDIDASTLKLSDDIEVDLSQHKSEALFLSKKYKEALALYLYEAGIKDASKEKTKKSSKGWSFNSVDKEATLGVLILKLQADDIQVQRNRYNSTAAKKENFNTKLAHIVLDLQMIYRNNSAIDCEHDRYSLKNLAIELITNRSIKLHPFILANVAWLLAKVFGKEFNLSPLDFSIIPEQVLKFSKYGYEWYASILAEAHQALKEEGYDDEFELEYLINDEFVKITEFLSVSEEEEWEVVLKKINTLAEDFKKNKKQASKGKSESRLLWVVADHQLYVQPMEQTKLKSGKWSKPKKISDRKLMTKQIKGMLDIDQDILSKAVKTYGRGYVDYDVLEVWKLLPGHPNVVLESDDNVSVIVEKRPMELHITEYKDTYKLFFDKDVNIDFPVKRETATRVIYYDVDKNVKSWSVNFPTDVIIPKSAKEQLKTVVASLGHSINVHSHVEEIQEELPEVMADNTIHALLSPRGNNILLEIFMKPYKTHPPYVTPAKGKEVLVEEIDRERTRCKRNLKQEEEIISQFFYHRPHLEMTHDGHFAWELRDREETLNTLLELQKGDVQPVVEWPKGARFKLLGNVSGSNINMQIQNKKRDWFAIGGDVQINEEVVVSLTDLMKQFRNDPNSKYVEIKENEFVALTDNLRKQLQALTSIGVEDKLEFRVHRMASYGVLNALSKEALVRADDSWTTLQSKIEETNGKVYPLPTTLQADLRDYQQDGYQWLSRLATWGGGACLADDMGLGKTLQGLALMLDKASDGPSLVIAPTSVTFNWVSEIRKFAPTITPKLLSASADRDQLIKDAKEYDIIICSYGLLQTNYKKMVEKDWNIVLLDEAQAIKNKTTKRSQVAMQLNGKMRVITTGTPIENNLAELWNLFEFINPGLLGNWESFNKNFILRITESGDEHHAKSAKKVLRKLIAPFILRRKKSEVLDELPPKTESVLSVDFNDDELTLYEAHRRTALEEIEGILQSKEQKDATLQVLAELTKLRQLCCHPQLIDHTWTLQGSKIKLLLETLHELKKGGHRALIFSQFVGFLQLIKNAIEDEGFTYQYLDGSTPLKKREKGISDFQKGLGDVYLISLKAGGTGLNLTAADYVIHMDPWWNPAVEDQATDRAHRIGQDRPVTVYRMITKNTIEEKMIALHSDKRELADDLLSGTSKASKLNTQELLKLLQANETLLKP